MRQQEREITYAIEHAKRIKREEDATKEGKIIDWAIYLEARAGYYVFELTSDWGMTPIRPLKNILKLIMIFWLPYSLIIGFSRSNGKLENRREGIWAVRSDVNERDPRDKLLKSWECVTPTFFFPKIHCPFSQTSYWWLWGYTIENCSYTFCGSLF